MIQRIDQIATAVLSGLLYTILLFSPWFFAAWEPRWFWPFMTLLSAATTCYAIRLICSATLGTRRLNFSTLIYGTLVMWIPFLIYALIRGVHADVVMDAERSLLLHLSPLLLGLMVATGLTESTQRRLPLFMLTNFILLGLYGIANHYLTGNAKVLWVPGFAQYQQDYHRATGTYFCPDHFAGLMELALALSLALLLVKSTSRPQRGVAAIISLVSCWGIILSRSRGGGLVACIMIIAALPLCTLAWPHNTRRVIRITGLTVLALGLTALVLWGGHYVKRFRDYPWNAIENSDRYQMTSAALRAWKSAPWLGVGPGMHQNLWPHFAPSSDGNRQQGIWPSHPNTTFHSYEAHNDWAQFLEEYGLLGVALFLLALASFAGSLYRRWRRWAAVESHSAQSQPVGEWLLPAGLLACLAMSMHSLGDFNLQMPATVWQLGALGGLAAATARNTPPHRSSRSRHSADGIGASTADSG